MLFLAIKVSILWTKYPCVFFWIKQSADGLSRPHLDFSNHLDQTADPQIEDSESRDLIWWRGGRGWNGTLWPDLATGAPPPPSSNQKYWVGQVCRPNCRCTKIPLTILETQQHTLGANSVTIIRDWSVFIPSQTNWIKNYNEEWQMLTCYEIAKATSGFISTEGALRLPTTYDNHPSNPIPSPSHPIHI